MPKSERPRRRATARATFVTLLLLAASISAAGCPSWLGGREQASTTGAPTPDKQPGDFRQIADVTPSAPSPDALLEEAMAGVHAPGDDEASLGARMQLREVRIPDVPRGAATQFNFGDGQRGWVTALPSSDLLTTPAYADGRVFLGGGFASHRFFAFSAFTGEMDWALAAPDGGPTAAIVEGDNVIFNTESCTLFVADADTGELRWSRWLGDPLMSQPAAADGMVLSAYPSNGAHVFGAFRLRDGEPRWQRDIPADVIQAPTVHGDSVYFATMDGTVFALALRNGRVRWRKSIGASSAVWVDGDRVMVTRRVSRGRHTMEEPLVLQAGNGNIVSRGERVRAPYLAGNSRDRRLASGQSGAWGSVPHGEHLGLANVASGWAFQGSSPTVAEGRAYQAVGNQIRARDLRTGRELWRRTYGEARGAQAISPPAVVGSQLVFGTVDGHVYFSDIDTGMTVRAWDVGEPVVFQPIVAQGWVYLATGEGSLIGLEIGDPHLDGWHMWGGNARHDGMVETAGTVSDALLASLERPGRGTMRVAAFEEQTSGGEAPSAQVGEDEASEADEAGDGESASDDDTSPDMPLLRTRVRAEVSGPVAEVIVTQSFENPHDRPIEALYLFPLPADAAVDEMEMRIGTRVVRGRIRRRAQARRVYEQARSEGRRAALLEQQRPNLFAQRVANIQPGEQIDVRIRYVQQLPFSDGSYELVYPMMAPARFDPSDVAAAARDARTMRQSGAVDLAVTIDAGLPIREVTTPTHEVVTEREGAHARVALAPDARTDRDFVLRYAVGGETPEASVFAHHAGEEGYFSLVVQPPEGAPLTQVTPRDVTFVLDTSSSMRGAPMDHARGVMARVLAGLGEQDRFNVVRFSDGVETLHEAPVAPNDVNLVAARTFIREARPVGATLMVPAIERALTGSTPEGRLGIVVLLTDGFIGNEAEVLRTIATGLGRRRVYAVGVGSAVNRFLLERAAEIGRGDVVVGTLSEASDAIGARLSVMIERPLFTDLEIDWGQLAVSDVYPRRLPDLFAGRPLVVRGRFERGGQATVRVRGTMAGRRYERLVHVTLPDAEAGAPPPSSNLTDAETPSRAHRAQATLWARAAVHDRMNRLYLRDDPALIEEVTQLGLRHHMVTQWTSFVAVDETSTPETQTDAEEENEAGEQARATVSPARSLPGDPEIRVPAPADALAVTVLLPFGETLAAAFEPDLGMWTTRFLVPRDAEEGTYPVDIMVTLASGEQQHLRVFYTVDQHAPVLDIDVLGEATPGGTVRVRASQILTEQDLHQVGRTRETLQPGRAHLLHDTRRVEARLAGGRVVDLELAGPGVWEAEVPVPLVAGGTLPLQLTIIDMAANVRTQSVDVRVVEGQ